MGTSSPHPGSNDRSPLVPEHADAEPGKPLPDPKPHRFRQFRRSMGHYVQSGDRADLNKGLGRYTRQATGGADVGPRRFGSAITAAGVAISALSALKSGEDPAQTGDLDAEQSARLQEAIGQPLSAAVDILADALASSGEDGDEVREALNFALSESLQDLDSETFDPDLLSEEVLAETMVCFLAEIVFIDIVKESGQAFEKTSSPEVLESREIEIRETIKVAVDKHLADSLMGGISDLSTSAIRDIQLSALKDVFAEWDGLE